MPIKKKAPAKKDYFKDIENAHKALIKYMKSGDYSSKPAERQFKIMSSSLTKMKPGRDKAKAKSIVMEDAKTITKHLEAEFKKLAKSIEQTKKPRK